MSRKEEEEERPYNFIGKGGFGYVVYDPNDETKAIKQLKRVNDQIQEVALMVYFRKSPYIINMHSFNISKLQITTERWSCDLRYALVKTRMSYMDKMKVFRDVLIGLSHMQSRQVLHSDLKLSNILVNLNNHSACITDMGLTSLISYAKIHNTATTYRPVKPKHTIGHDIFSLCILCSFMFGEIPIPHKPEGVKIPDRELQRSPSELREQIMNSTKFENETIRDIVYSMAKDDLRQCPTASEILMRVAGIQVELAQETIHLYENTLDPEMMKYLMNSIIALSGHYQIKRPKRIYMVLLNYFNSPKFEGTEDDYRLYIVTTMIIFSSLFGGDGFGIGHAIEASNNTVNENQINNTLNILLKDKNFIAQVLNPSSDKLM